MVHTVCYRDVLKGPADDIKSGLAAEELVIYFHAHNVQVAKAVVRLCVYSGSSELSLVCVFKYHNLEFWLIFSLRGGAMYYPLF